MYDYVSMDHLRFLLFDVLKTEELLVSPLFGAYDKDALNIVLDAFKDFSDSECFPYLREMDEKPVYFKDGQVYVHDQIKTIMEKTGELGLIASGFSEDKGGLQLPYVISQAAYYIIDAANNHVSGYPGLTAGAANLMVTFGDEGQFQQYLPNMLAGKWAGTMCLTEPQAGSSLSDITTTAYPQPDGSYHMEGQKIWISGGDQQFSENIIHLVLARIAGAPAGTKGISLFVVPKLLTTSSGALITNNVTTAGDFHKLGQRGYSSVHLVFGDGAPCKGWLVGEPHQGLKYMFQMMNGARIAVGRSAAAITSAAYYASLKYANERPQGRRVNDAGTKDLSVSQTLIINHADVRRMLFLQKTIAEGAISLILQAAFYADKEAIATSEAERHHYNTLLEMLTPVVKTYPSEMGKVAVSNGLQVLGGMGFSSEHILQQYYRDIRIMPIYEGTTGIQSIDLLGRKMTMDNGNGIRLLSKEMEETISQAFEFSELKGYAQKLEEQLQLNQKVLEYLLQFAAKGAFERFLSDATIFMDFFGTLVIGWQWLKMGIRAQQMLNASDPTYSKNFYESKIQCMKFFFKYELPKMEALSKTLMDPDVLTLVLEDKELLF